MTREIVIRAVGGNRYALYGSLDTHTALRGQLAGEEGLVAYLKSSDPDATQFRKREKLVVHVQNVGDSDQSRVRAALKGVLHKTHTISFGR